jgi:hypothetical protein
MRFPMKRPPFTNRAVAAPLLAAVLLAACTAGSASAPSASGPGSAGPAEGSSAAPAASSAAPFDRPSATPHGQLIPSPAASPITGEVPADILASVRAQLAGKVGQAAADQATVEVAQAVTWPDGSLGCPQPGMFYTQMVVKGYQVVLVVDGKKYDYRIGAGGKPSLCENGRPHNVAPSPSA